MKTFSILLLCVLSFASHAADSVPLQPIKTIPLPGVKGRFDHFAIDTKGHRLFVAALANNTLEVLDISAAKPVKSISGLHKPTGVVFLPDENQIGVANGADGTFKLFDATSFELVHNLTGLDDADNVRRDPKTKLTYIGYGDGALAILDRTGRKKLGEVRLPGHPESFQLEAGGPRIFVNVPDARQIAVIDRDRREVVAQWRVEKLEANFPMALDEANQLLFIGCRTPVPWIMAIGAGSGGLVKVLGISGDIDDLFYDAKRRCLYASCGEGFIDVIAQKGRADYESLAKIPTRAGARTCYYSAELDLLFLAVPQHDSHDAEIRIYEPAKTAFR